MKILHITNTLSSGGVTTFLIELLNYLSENNKVTLLLLGRDEEPYLKKQFKENIEIIFLNQNRLRSLKNILIIRKYIKDNDIVHAHLFPTFYIVAIASLFLDKKLIVTEHTADNNRRKYKLFKYLDKWIYNKYQSIIPCSYEAEVNLQKWLGKDLDNKMKTIPNGISLLKYNDIENKRNKIWNLTKKQKLICMIARFSKQKDQKTLLKALKLLPDNIKCIFIGIGETLEEMINYSKKINLDKERVQFLGYRHDVPSILKSCDLNILSTFYEGLPFILLESMAIGTITIGSDVPGVRDILKKQELLFECQNDNELAEKILNILNNNELKKKLENYLKREILKYDVKIMLNKYDEIYKKFK